jgi:hypothetical protein
MIKTSHGFDREEMANLIRRVETETTVKYSQDNDLEETE